MLCVRRSGFCYASVGRSEAWFRCLLPANGREVTIYYTFIYPSCFGFPPGLSPPLSSSPLRFVLVHFTHSHFLSPFIHLPIIHFLIITHLPPSISSFSSLTHTHQHINIVDSLSDNVAFSFDTRFTVTVTVPILSFPTASSSLRVSLYPPQSFPSHPISPCTYLIPRLRIPVDRMVSNTLVSPPMQLSIFKLGLWMILSYFYFFLVHPILHSGFH